MSVTLASAHIHCNVIDSTTSKLQRNITLESLCNTVSAPVQTACLLHCHTRVAKYFMHL